MLLSVPIIVRNCVKLKYPLDKVVHSVVGLADEVIILADPASEDDTLDYIYDLALDINSQVAEHGTTVQWYLSAWDLNNITSTGLEFSRQTNIAMDLCEGEWVLSLQADEAIHEDDFSKIRKLMYNSDGIDAYSMVRIYFYGDINTVREDWTVPIVRLFRRGTCRSCDDAMNTTPVGKGRTVDCDVPIYHYSRIGDPDIISKRILSLDKLFHSGDKLLNEKELQSYDFSTHNFDCMHRDGVDIGRKKVKCTLSRYIGTHPAVFVNYKGE